VAEETEPRQVFGRKVVDIGASVFLGDLAIGILLYEVINPLFFVIGAMFGLAITLFGLHLELSS
jgi:hypothetical protein